MASRPAVWLVVCGLILGSWGAALACTSAAECDDGVECTEDSCETAGGMAGDLVCVHTPRHIFCFDGNACTTDTCTSGGCVHGPIDCADDSSCTRDTCDRLLGCVHTLDCDDGIACTRDFCGEAGDMSGDRVCFHEPEPAECDDGDPCTTDACGFGGCTHEPADCDDGSPCTRDTCDPLLGCRHRLDCDDGVACTRDFCGQAGDMSGGEACVHEPEPAACDDGDACTTDACGFGGCTHEPADCNDDNLCTRDTCDPILGCRNTLDCDDGVACTRDFCGEAGDMSGDRVCFHEPEPAECDDGDACTTDACGFGGCTNEPVDCDDGDACTDDSCTAGMCGHEPIDCDDGDRCTLDACAAGQCVCEIDPTCAAQGCTPGYWKTNAQKRGASAWPIEYAPSTKIRDVFTIPGCIGTATGNATLLQGLNFGGGSSLKGSAQTLLRAAIAAVLNGASTCVQYPLCLADVLAQADEALATCERKPIVAAAKAFEAQNVLGCPLTQQGACTNR